MNSSSNVVLVTGGAGYIGSHTCKALHRAGYLPVAYDNLVHGHEEAVKWGPLEQGDILDAARLSEVLEKHQPVAALHFAAYAYVGESVQFPQKYYENNFVGTLRLLEAILKHDVKNLVFSSSCATYGIPDVLPIQEDSLQRPINPYGHSKLMAEQAIKDFGSSYDLNSMILRYFNAAGADPDCEIGEDHDPETHLIPLVIDAALGKRKDITVFGTDYPTEDGTCIRDYIHVTDLADAHVAALGALLRGEASNIYNLGTGSGYSVREVIDGVERITGKSVPVVYGERREGDPPILVSDASKVRRELSWKPKHSDLDTIIRTVLNKRQD